MRRIFSYGVAGALVVLGFGCGQKSGPASTASAAPVTRAAPVDDLPTRAQPKLSTIDLFLGKQRIQAEVARTLDQIRTGMMYRTSISDDEGMLFVFARPHRASFWMKNVTVELSVAYLDSEGRILEIHDLVPGEETPVESAEARVQFVLETSRGWFERHEVKSGTLVRTAVGSLKETFRLP